MPTQCNAKPLEFEGFGRRVVAAFDGGPITSDASALLLRRVEQRLSLFDQVADCFTDHRIRSGPSRWPWLPAVPTSGSSAWPGLNSPLRHYRPDPQSSPLTRGPLARRQGCGCFRAKPLPDRPRRRSEVPAAGYSLRFYPPTLTNPAKTPSIASLAPHLQTRGEKCGLAS